MDETMTAEPQGAEVVRYAPAAVEEYRPRIVLAPEEAKALDDSLRANMKAVLHEDSDYGVIPGTKGKPTLLKPGAEKLLQWFGFGHTMERAETERDADGSRIGVTYRCTVTKTLPDGRVALVATCEGYAGYDEDRFFTPAEEMEAKERANAEKYHRNPNPAKFAEYRAPWNSVIKMSQKRAMVGAALQATSASSLFTQDMEDTAPAADPGALLGEQAMPSIKALPPDVLAGLDRWYRAQGWPGPSKWNTEQWCQGLIQAGRLDAQAQAQVVDGVVVEDLPEGMDPADEWMAKVQEIADGEDVAAARANLEVSRTKGMDPARANQISAAIDAKAATLESRAA